MFRAPYRLLVFSALVGTGHQLALLVFSVILFSTVGNYYRTYDCNFVSTKKINFLCSRGSVVTAFIFLYALSSFIGGYGAGGYYARNGGTGFLSCFVCHAHNI